MVQSMCIQNSTVTLPIFPVRKLTCLKVTQNFGSGSFIRTQCVCHHPQMLLLFKKQRNVFILMFLFKKQSRIFCNQALMAMFRARKK